MKKKMAFWAAAFACATAFAGMNNLRIMFSTPGPDTYADGTEVKAGERYALVWKANAQAEFSIAADGTTSGGDVILVYPTREDGHCTPVLFQADEGWMKEKGYNTGSWSVYLMDTRLADGGYSKLGADGLPTVVNASGVATAAVDVQGSATPSGTVASADQTALPDGVTDPVVQSIEFDAQFVYVTVTNTFSSLQYTLASGDEPGSLSADAGANAKNGDDKATGAITIVTPKKEGSGFFQVIRK